MLLMLTTPALASDSDGDGIDAIDNCPTVYNPDQIDSNGDGIGDACTIYHCVTNSEELHEVLTAARANNRYDIIMLEQGMYAVPEISHSFGCLLVDVYGVSLSGGYYDGCHKRNIDPNNTVLCDTTPTNRILSIGRFDTSISVPQVDKVSVEGLSMKSGALGVFINSMGEINFSKNIISGNTNSGVLISKDIFANENTVTGNNDKDFWMTGLHFKASGDLLLNRNVITGNSIYGHIRGQGAGISIDESGNVYLLNNLIADNKITMISGSGEGAGIYLESKSLTMINNTICNNRISAPGYAGRGGGIMFQLEYAQDANFYNNIFWGNSANNYSDIFFYNTLTEVNVFNNNYSPSKAFFGSIINEGNNLDTDPLYINSSIGDYHLAATSPLINKGSNTAPSLPVEDLSGNPRITAGIADIGAHEYNPVTAAFSASPVNGLSSLLVNFSDLSSSTNSSILLWSWDFNNDGITDSTEQNPSFLYSQVGIYSVRLTVTDSSGAVNTILKEGYVAAGDTTDIDGDNIPDALDDCPNTYNPQQKDLDGNRIGDACQGSIFLLDQATSITGMKSATVADVNLVDQTALMKDGLLSQGVTILKSKGSFYILSFQSNVDSNTLSAASLNIYVNQGAPASATIYAYTADGKSVQATALNFSITAGWNKLNLSPILHLMDGFGFIKFRIVTTGSFSISEAYFTESVDAQEITVTPSRLDFGSIETGSQTLTVSNTGNGNLNIVNIVPPTTPFSITSDGCSGIVLPSSASCSVTVEYNQTSPGTHFDSLQILSNDGDHSSARVRLAAIPQPADLTVAVTSGDLTGMYTIFEVATVTVTDPLGPNSRYTDDLNSNNHGKAIFYGLTPGNFTVTCQLEGYATKSLSGVLQSGQNSIVVPMESLPPIIIASPQDGAVLNSSSITVSGNVYPRPNTPALVLVNGVQVAAVNNTFSAVIPLNEGSNIITVRVTTQDGYNASKSISVTCVTRGIIVGTVTNSSNGLPLSAATVSVTDSTNAIHTAVSASDGTFSIAALPPGNFSGTVTKNGYSPYAISGTITSGGTVTVNAALTSLLPVISAVKAVSSAVNSATITWATDQPSSSLVEYGTTASYGSSATDAALVTSHGVTISGLIPATTYHFRVSSTDAYGYTSFSSDLTFTTPLFTVKSLEDIGNVTVMEAIGSFDAKNPDGTVNDQPRQAIAKEYFKTHEDLDFLVILSTFDYALPDTNAQGFYLGVKNDIQGIGQSLFDNTAAYGSAGKLQGTIDLGNVTELTLSPYGTILDEKVRTLNHELQHRFGAFVHFKNPDGSLNAALLGKDDTHWSYLLDTQGSIMYGNGWKDNGDGTFTSTTGTNIFSPLDQYLMGMIPKEQVPPMLLIENEAVDNTQLPQPGATISGTAKTVTIEDIIATEGARVPNSTNSQKIFNVAFVLLTRPGDVPGNAPAAIETLRGAWAGRFAWLTQGIGEVADVPVALNLYVDSPADESTITGPDVTVTGTVINTSGAETGITVNGMPAAVSGSRFIVNRVPLQAGENTITTTAVDVNGLTVSNTRTVTSVSGYYLRIVPSVESGVAPLDISLRLDGSFIIDNPVISVSGPVPVTLAQGSSTSDYTATLSVEGTYTITANATGPDGLIYSNTLIITVQSRSQLEHLLQSKWEGMKDKIATNDVEGAVAFFVGSLQQEMREMFTAAGSSLSSLSGYMNEINLVYVTDDIAKCSLTRPEIVSGQTQQIEYAIYFTKENGLWKLQDF